MTVMVEQNTISETREWFVSRAADLLGDTAQFARDTARSLARRRSTYMMNAIEDQGKGLDRSVVAVAPYTIYHEFGTGIYAEGQSQAKDLPWVYYDEYLGQFFTTYGVRPQPMMRPGYEAGKEYLLRSARGYFG